MATLQAIDTSLRQVRKDIERTKVVHAQLCIRLKKVHPIRRRKIADVLLSDYVEQYNLFMQHRLLLEDIRRLLAH